MAAREFGTMDRDEALKLLKGGSEGIKEWNWRRGRRGGGRGDS